MLNFAIIGPGRMGKMYGKIIQKNKLGNVVAITAHSEAGAKAAREMFAVPVYPENQWDKMFASHPEIDVVVITTSDWAHRKPFEAAVRAGKKIVLEKPLATSLDDLTAMDKLVRENKSQVFVCHTSRFDPRFAQAHGLIEQKKLGKLSYIFSRRNADLKTAERVLGKMPMAFWITPHDVDLIRWFSSDEIVKVQGFQDERLTAGNYLVVNLDTVAGGRGLVEINWQGVDANFQHAARFDAQFERGRIEMDLNDRAVCWESRDSGVHTESCMDGVEVGGAITGNSANMLKYFSDVFSRNDFTDSSFSSWRDGFKSTLVCHALDVSIKEKRAVMLKEFTC